MRIHYVMLNSISIKMKCVTNVNQSVSIWLNDRRKTFVQQPQRTLIEIVFFAILMFLSQRNTCWLRLSIGKFQRKTSFRLAKKTSSTVSTIVVFPSVFLCIVKTAIFGQCFFLIHASLNVNHIIILTRFLRGFIFSFFSVVCKVLFVRDMKGEKKNPKSYCE